MDAKKLKNILEAGLLVAGRTLSIAQLEALFQHDSDQPARKEIKEALQELQSEYEGRGIELVEVASGYRLQSHASVSDWVANLFQEKAPRYSRALLETLVLVAYRQPITRAEIEEVRGVAVSSNIIKTLQERQWIKVLGHKDVPGRPALLGTTKEFLDYFNLKKLDDLPALADIKDLDQFDDLLAAEAGDDNTDDGGADNNDKPDVNGSGGVHHDLNGSKPDNNNDGALIDLGVATDNSEESAADSDTPSEAPDDDADPPNPDAKQLLDGEPQSDATHHENEADDQANDNQATDEDDDPDAHSETLSGPELQLLQVISDFSEEHQAEIDARDEMESRVLSGNANEEADIADLSQRVGDERSGELPEPGDTLH